MKKKVLAIITSACLATAMLPASALAVDFSDTQNHWAAEAIDRWSDYGVVNGMGGNTFAPGGDMTRAQAAQVFANLLKLDGQADMSGYTDVPADAWYADALAACVDKGILNGVGNGAMNPEGTITREMFFTMFARALGIEEATSLNQPFADSGSISSWARGSVYALVNHGYVHGMTGTTIAPGADINRASVMALLDQTIVEYVVTNGTYTVNEDGVVLVLADNVTVSGSGDVNVVVGSEGAKVSLSGATGAVEVTALENNVAVTNAPAGTTITAVEGVTGTTANGQAVTAGGEVTIPAQTTGGGGGGSVTPTPDPDPDPVERPTIIVGDKEYTWDADEQEYVTGDGDEKEYLSQDDLKEQGVIIVDGKEYTYDNGEWSEIIFGDDDEEEKVPVSDDEMDDILQGSNESETVD